MNNLKKVGLTALATTLVASSAYAGELSVAGSAAISYTGLSNNSTTNPWAMGNSVTFTGSGELDNGTTFKAYWELDNDVMDDYNMTFGLPNDMGEIKFIGDSGLAGGLGKVADIVPTAYEEVYDVTDGTDYGVATRSFATNANWGYTWTGNGLMVSAQYNPFPAEGENSATSYGVTYDIPGMDGLMLALGTGSDGEENDVDTYGIKYTLGNVTAAYQKTDISFAAGSSNDEEGTHYGVSVAINDNLSVSAGVQETDFATGTVDEENTGYSASYTMGGMTIAYSFNKSENPAGSTSAKEIEASVLNLSFAF